MKIDRLLSEIWNGATTPVRKEFNKSLKRFQKASKARRKQTELGNLASNIAQTIWVGRHGGSLLEREMGDPDEYLARFGISPRAADAMRRSSRDLWTLRQRIEEVLKNR